MEKTTLNVLTCDSSAQTYYALCSIFLQCIEKNQIILLKFIGYTELKTVFGYSRIHFFHEIMQYEKTQLIWPFLPVKKNLW